MWVQIHVVVWDVTVVHCVHSFLALEVSVVVVAIIVIVILVAGWEIGIILVILVSGEWTVFVFTRTAFRNKMTRFATIVACLLRIWVVGLRRIIVLVARVKVLGIGLLCWVIRR
jgi:hypothetical protein